MIVHAIVARAPRALAGIVLVLSGAYMLIYLYRWEWNRAIISGVFFVAAEVALATSVILRRLEGIEQRQAAADASPLVLDRLRSTPVDRPDTFAWLKPRGDQLSVFIPVLLGAGAILSTLAYVIERVATATALPGMDRRLATRLAALAPPAEGLLGSRSTLAQRTIVEAPRARARGASLAATALAVAAVTVVGWLGVQALLEATQSRPDPADRPERTTIEMSIAERRSLGSPSAAAEALWVSCRSTLGSLPVVAEVTALGGDRVALVLEPGIGRLSRRRLTGCLGDLQIDLVKASVREVESLD